jgi:ABC-type nitrate/sulfonate/bicarbonate transport system substrate-binding protein
MAGGRLGSFLGVLGPARESLAIDFCPPAIQRIGELIEAPERLCDKGMDLSPTYSRRTVIAAAAAAACSPAPPPASAPNATIPLSVADAAGALNQAMHALMKRMQYYEKFGLKPDLVEVSDGSKILGGVVNGSVDGTMMAGFNQVFPAIERGAALKILAGGALIPVLSLFTSKPEVQSLKDLEGRVVGSGSVGALVYQLTVTLLRKYGVDVSKVKFVNIGSTADITRAIAAGTVDAGTAAGSLADTGETRKFRLIPHGVMAEELKDYTFQGAWTSDEKIATERDKLVRALAAHAKLYRFVQTPESKGPFIESRRTVFTSETDAEHEAEWDFIQRYKPFAVDLALSPARMEYMQKINIDFAVQKTMLPFERVADMSLAADAIKLLEKMG